MANILHCQRTRGEIMDYEQLGTTAVIHAVSKTDRLKAFVNSGDKEPSFDGSIYIYDNNKYSKDNIKRVAVQVKGKGVLSKPTATIKYPVSVTDLENFMQNGGVMFFVVYIDRESGNTKQIYYSALLPFKIKEILKSKKNAAKNVRIKFRQLPVDVDEITELFLNFHSNAQKQISFIGKELPTIEDLYQNGLLESLTFTYVSMQGNQDVTSYPKLLDGKELYLYANIKGGVAPIPVEYYSQISQLQLSCTDEIPIGVNGVVYYSGLEKTITAERIIYRIGSSVTISIPNLDEPVDDMEEQKGNVNVKLRGTLKQRIQALEFLVAMFEARNFDFGGINFPANFPEAELEKINPNDYPEILSGYKRVLAVLEKLNVKKDLALDVFTEEDFVKLNSLVGAIENGTPVRTVKDDLPSIVSLNFGGLRLIMICRKQEDGTYLLWDYFNKQIDICVVNRDNEKLPASQYSIMKADDFLKIDNLRLQSVVDDFKRIAPQQFIVENGNVIMLEMLKAYDKEPNAELFDAIKQMHSWFETVHQYLTDEVMLINKLQIVRRERELTFAEKQQLFAIASSSEDVAYRIGALILLNELGEAERLLNDMPQEGKDEFMSYPIFRFYTKPKKNENKHSDNVSSGCGIGIYS